MNKLLFILLWIAVSCTSRSVNGNLPKKSVQKREGYTVMAQAMADTENSAGNAGEKAFKVTLLMEKAFLENHPDLSKNLQYGVDSAFYAVAKKDTVWPLYVLPVANGQPLQPQFVVAFDKQPLQKVSDITLQTNINGLEPADSLGLTLDIPKQN